MEINNSILNKEISEIAPVTYNVKLLDNNASEILFDNNFLALGNDLQIELISDVNANKTIMYSPDMADPEGRYDYYCTIHPWMVGQIFVTSISSSTSDTN